MSANSVNNNDLDQPIALRRSKRRSEAISPIKKSAADSTVHRPDNAAPFTPSKTRSKKRVRFSDPAPFATASSAASSGLTPYVGRTTLDTSRRHVSTPATTRTNPVEIQFTPMRQMLDGRTKRRIRRNGLSQEMNAYESERKNSVWLEKELREKDQELQKLKDELEAVRHAHDPANHQKLIQLSSSQRTVEAELETLRQSFTEASIPLSFDDGDEDDMDINWDAVDVRKAGATPASVSDGGDTIPIYEDNADMPEPATSAAKVVNGTTKGPVDTTADAELLAMALDLETAKQEKRQLFKDLRAHIPTSQPLPLNSTSSTSSLHFEDSPARSTPNQQEKQQQQHHYPSITTSTPSLPSPPKAFYTDLAKALKSTTHRAETAELALRALETDLQTLGFTPTPSPSSSSSSSSTPSILETIRLHFRQARLDVEHILPGESTIPLTTPPATVLPLAISKLKLLSLRVRDRESELQAMRSQQRSLKGNFECSLLAAEKASQRIKELEDAIEEGAADMLSLRMKVQATERDIGEKDHTISSLIAALEKYRADVARLEGLVVALEHEQSFKVQEAREANCQQLEEWEARAAAESTGRKKAEESAVQRLRTIGTLQTALEVALSDAAALQLRLSALEAERADSLSAQLVAEQQQHDFALQGLNTRLSALSTALSASHAESTRLAAQVAKLQERLRVSEEASSRAVEALWEEHVRSVTKASEVRKSYVRGQKVRGANWEMEDEDLLAAEGEGEGEGGPMTPVSLVRFVDVDAQTDGETEGDGEGEVEGRVEIARGRSAGRSRRRLSRGLGIVMSSSRSSSMKKGRLGRRSLDSGIGMGCLSEEDEGADEESELLLSSDAIGMPSSDSGFDIHEDAADVALPSSELGMQD